jgi:hypothetical protein
LIVLREILSITIFAISVVLVIDSVADNFEPIFFLIGCLGYVVSYWLWPSKKRGYMRCDHWIYDVIEIVVELPVSILVWFYRLIVSAIKALDFT